MPGMMDTVLNLGLNPDTVQGLIRSRATSASLGRVAAVRRDVRPDRARPEGRGLRRAVRRRASRTPAKLDTDLTAEQLRDIGNRFAKIVEGEDGASSRPIRIEQLELAVRAVFASWFGKRAHDYREFNKIPHDLGTAVNVVAMVFGNMGEDSGTGVAFTRDPNTGEKVLFGEYLTNAQGEDVVAGVRTPSPTSASCATRCPRSTRSSRGSASGSSSHYRDVQDLEFTIERGRSTCSRRVRRSAPRRPR